MRRAPAAAKLNLSLVVGPPRSDGMHEVVTVYQRLDLCDRVGVERASALEVTGFAGDTLVTRALRLLGERAGREPGFRARIWKHIPVAAGLGGGSTDAATALRLANETLEQPLEREELRGIAAALGADVPFCLENGPQLGEGFGERLTPLDLPQDYWVLLLVPNDRAKSSSAEVYATFDARAGAEGFEGRRRRLLDVLEAVRRPRDLAALPPNDLAASPLAAELRGLGAFRADVSGAGPAVYGLFHHEDAARAARSRFRGRARAWITLPAWYV